MTAAMFIDISSGTHLLLTIVVKQLAHIAAVCTQQQCAQCAVALAVYTWVGCGQLVRVGTACAVNQSIPFGNCMQVMLSEFWLLPLDPKETAALISHTVQRANNTLHCAPRWACIVSAGPLVVTHAPTQGNYAWSLTGCIVLALRSVLCTHLIAHLL